MLDVQNPHIDVDELMEKIRAEVARRRSAGGIADTVDDEPSQGVTYVEKPVSGNWFQVKNALSMAEQVSQVGTRLPGMHTFRGLKRKIALFTGRVFLRVSQVITRDQRAFNGSVLTAIRALENTTKHIESIVSDNPEYIRRFDNIESTQAKTEESLNEFVYRVGSVESKSNEQISAILSRLEEISSRVSVIEEQVKTGESLSGTLSQLEDANNRVNGVENEIRNALKQLGYLKSSLLLQERRITMLIEEARRRLPEPFSKDQLESFIDKAWDIHDVLYWEFEDQFRGTRERFEPLILESNPLILLFS